MPACQILVRTESTPGGASTPLGDAWVYWRASGAVTVHRTDGSGRLMNLNDGAEASHPWEYTTTAFTTDSGSTVDLFHSRGARPFPSSRLSDPPAVFVTKTITLPPTPAPQAASVAPSSPNTLTVTPTATVILPAMSITVATPAELSLWPMLWGPLPDGYATDGLVQGAELWPEHADPTLHVNDPAPAPSSAVRPEERGLRVHGTLPPGATGFKLQIANGDGDLMSLRPTVESVDGVDQLTGPAGSGGAFDATIYFTNPTAPLGPVQLIVDADGVTPPQRANFACLLAGVQLGLVADSQDGRARGAVPGEAQEKIIVDFSHSPKPSLTELTAEARARRMAAYDIGHRVRAFSDADATQVRKPEMPMWMAELHLVGLEQAAIEDLLLRRAHLPTPVNNLRFALEWGLGLEWDGPDFESHSPRQYRYRQSFTESQRVALSLDANHQLVAGADGQVENAFATAPAVIPFPVDNRRLPGVIVSGQSRAWGRQSGAGAIASTLIEWQPRIVDGEREIIRGGNGTLVLNLSVDDSRVDGGVVDPTPDSPMADAILPLFRVRGLNPPNLPLDLIDALAAEQYAELSGAEHLNILTLDLWKATVRLLIQWESHGKNQFTEAAQAGRYQYQGVFFGRQQDMPLFGPPHGYGLGQLDNPPVTDDSAWSFMDNVLASVRLTMESKGRVALSDLRGEHAFPPSPITPRAQAVFQRAVVRRYNGGSEFVWSGGDWMISPSGHDHSRMLYPNHVLHTTVSYSAPHPSRSPPTQRRSAKVERSSPGLSASKLPQRTQGTQRQNPFSAFSARSAVAFRSIRVKRALAAMPFT